jgi:HK97 family phage portal protein
MAKFNLTKLFSSKKQQTAKMIDAKGSIYFSNQSGSSHKNYRNFAYNGFTENVIVHRAIGMIAKSASSVEVQLFVDNVLQPKTHQVLNLFNKPNSQTSRVQFIENIISYFLIAGNSYIYISKDENGNPSEMQTLRPDRMRLIPIDSGDDFLYRYTIDGATYDFPCINNTKCDIMHFKNFNPLDDWYGLSCLEAADLSIQQHNECLRWNKALLSNGARPTGALVVQKDGAYGGVLTDDQFDRLKSQINSTVAGHDNAGRIMILEGGLQWQEMSISPKDMDFTEMKNGAARDIALSIGVPPQMLGIKGDNTYSNFSEARIAFWEETVLPLLNNFYDNFSTWLSAHFNQNISLKIDPDTISALSSQRQILWDNLKSTTFITDAEKRSMLGFDK